jgi:hypothetical protein
LSHPNDETVAISGVNIFAEAITSKVLRYT